MEKKKFDWLLFARIVGVVITIAGVICALVCGSILELNKTKIFGVISLPFLALIVAFVGFIVFISARRVEMVKGFHKENNENVAERQTKHKEIVLGKNEKIEKKYKIEKKEN